MDYLAEYKGKGLKSLMQSDKQKLSLERGIFFLLSHSSSSFAQWRYSNQWSNREVLLLLVENYTQYPALLVWNITSWGNFWRLPRKQTFTDHYILLNDISLNPVLLLCWMWKPAPHCFEGVCVNFCKSIDKSIFNVIPIKEHAYKKKKWVNSNYDLIQYEQFNHKKFAQVL